MGRGAPHPEIEYEVGGQAAASVPAPTLGQSRDAAAVYHPYLPPLPPCLSHTASSGPCPAISTPSLCPPPLPLSPPHLPMGRLYSHCSLEHGLNLAHSSAASSVPLLGLGWGPSSVLQAGEVMELNGKWGVSWGRGRGAGGVEA